MVVRIAVDEVNLRRKVRGLWSWSRRAADMRRGVCVVAIILVRLSRREQRCPCSPSRPGIYGRSSFPDPERRECLASSYAFHGFQNAAVIDSPNINYGQQLIASRARGRHGTVGQICGNSRRDSRHPRGPGKRPHPSRLSFRRRLVEHGRDHRSTRVAVARKPNVVIGVWLSAARAVRHAGVLDYVTEATRGLASR